MALKGILFDLYGTLIDIETDESMEEIYRSIANFLTYLGAKAHRSEVRDLYYRIMKEQKEQRAEKYPEVDVVDIWSRFLGKQGIPENLENRQFSLILAQFYRSISRKRLQLYPSVKYVLDELKSSFPLAIVSDAQACWALPEMRAVSLEGYFESIIISSDFGFRKPDSRLFHYALEEMGISPDEALHVGNDMYRDIYGAKSLDMKTVLFLSGQGTVSSGETKADYVIHRFEEVLNVVTQLSSV